MITDIPSGGVPPSGIVVDASIAIAWLLADEENVDAENVLVQIRVHAAHAPELWLVETRNALLNAERRSRIDGDQTRLLLRLLERMPIAVDAGADLDETLDLARRHSLSVYDAVYLELAGRIGAALATLDNELAAAARAEGVPTVLAEAAP